ncbi:hypothetical protein KKI95_19280 [Xenorhabdus bovienii]|uniref:hypothetical protein n=1 Tax=Xenorhabdus bovienii TaxID=40576 RepID=UPI00237C8896|nr:hypothetical protein [Xenorhabdus bovienii]MDE1476601.1 hypothetical protein [Xenorhabdus bovienii]MDE9437986.1 hypothetical protein [Xenorhabdus bovienii]MDE9499809.1 hypothetical protein [Xenorhabdus bovienii]MDE9541228.1 hypothetical protein [Xenorhabdus bovienii]
METSFVAEVIIRLSNGTTDLEPETEKDPEQTEQPKPTERPRFSAPHRRDDGQWVVRFEYSGQNYSWVGQADNLKEAMIQAWLAYFD